MEVPALSEHVYRILAALSRGPSHGYGLLQRIEDSGFTIGTGTLYSALKRLRREGVVTEVAAPEEADDRRRYYRLTEVGSGWLLAERSRLERLVRLPVTEGVTEAPAKGGSLGENA